jgi:hypothetical protein
VDILDALMVAQVAVGIPVGPTPFHCNVFIQTDHPTVPGTSCCGTELTILDALMIARHLVGLQPTLACY